MVEIKSNEGHVEIAAEGTAQEIVVDMVIGVKNVLGELNLEHPYDYFRLMLAHAEAWENMKNESV